MKCLNVDIVTASMCFTLADYVEHNITLNIIFSIWHSQSSQFPVI